MREVEAKSHVNKNAYVKHVIRAPGRGRFAGPITVILTFIKNHFIQNTSRAFNFQDFAFTFEKMIDF